ncbi:MAG: hypothetical protein KKD35_01710 [Elusimicrobia bacterium]|nr:hypothetical protein [Elusimicrobiota bacterium]
MKNLIKNLNKKDYKIIIIVAVVILLISFSIPFYFKVNTPDGYLYNWRVSYSHNDSYGYYGYIDQAKEGHFLFRDLYQSDSSYIIFNYFWLGLGLIARLFGLSAITIFYLSKLIFIPLFLFIFYLFLSFFFREKSLVRFAFSLGVFGMGFGGFFLPFNQILRLLGWRGITPVDFMPEATIFSNLLYSPHFIFALTLFVFIILMTLLFLDTRKFKYGVYSGIAGLLLFQFHPFPLITFATLYLIYLIYLYFIRDKKFASFFKYTILFFALSSPSWLYHIIMFWRNEWWHIQGVNNAVETPHIIVLLIVFAPWLWFLRAGIKCIKKKSIEFKNVDFMFFWIVINFVVIYLPIAFQRRLLEGWQLSILPFAAIGIIYGLSKQKINIKRDYLYIFPILAILFFSTSSIYVYWRFSLAKFNEEVFFNKTELFEAIDWIKYNSEIDNIVFSSEDISNILAGRSLRRVYLGHWAETLDARYKSKQTQLFLTEMDAKEREGFLDRENIDFVLFDQQWAAEGASNLDEEDFLEKVYERGEYKIYKVKI